jgi:hypothetical protein
LSRKKYKKTCNSISRNGGLLLGAPLSDSRVDFKFLVERVLVRFQRRCSFILKKMVLLLAPLFYLEINFTDFSLEHYNVVNAITTKGGTFNPEENKRCYWYHHFTK